MRAAAVNKRKLLLIKTDGKNKDHNPGQIRLPAPADGPATCACPDCGGIQFSERAVGFWHVKPADG